MAILNTNLKFQYSGGLANEDPNASLGGQISTATNNNVISNILHNIFDEVTKAEAVTGEYEVRHMYIRNSNTYNVKNARLIVLADHTSIWSKLEFAKGTAANGTVEQAVPNENTLPAGIPDDKWLIPSVSNPLLLGDIDADMTASIWIRRKVEPGSLIARNENLHIRIIADPQIPAAPPIECPTGQHYDTATQTCVDDEDPDDPGTGTPCPDGEVLQNGQCVPIGSPTPPDPVLFAVAADISCGSNAEHVLSLVSALRDTANEEQKGFLFIANGDLSYSSRADCFLEMLDFINVTDSTKISIGNHDDEEDGSSSLRAAFLSHFSVPSGGYYSFNIQNIHVLVMDTQSNYGPTSAQFTFAKNDLIQAKANSQIDWIIVCYHKPSLTMPSDHPPLTDFRDLYHPLFDQYKVDVVISGHNHNMQRSYPIKHNATNPTSPTIVSTVSTHNYTDVDGRIFFVSGAGGRSHHDLPGSRPAHFAFGEDNEYGLLLMEFVLNNKTLVCRFLAVSGSSDDDDPTLTLEELDRVQINKTT